MIIKEIYQKTKNNFLFKDSNKFISLRDSIIGNFDLSAKNKKNNESLKHLDPHVFDFSYKYKNFDSKINFLGHEENKLNIEVLDGKIIKVEKPHINTSDIKINNIDNENILIEEKFLEFQKLFKDDYVLNLNSLMLNSGYEVKIQKSEPTTIFISNLVSEKGLTIFQKNMITCSKGSNVTIVEEHFADKPSNINIVNYIDIEEGANLTHLIFQKK